MELSLRKSIVWQYDNKTLKSSSSLCFRLFANVGKTCNVCKQSLLPKFNTGMVNRNSLLSEVNVQERQYTAFS